MPSTLLDFPPELLRLIVAHTPFSALKELRLTAKAFNPYVRGGLAPLLLSSLTHLAFQVIPLLFTAKLDKVYFSGEQASTRLSEATCSAIRHAVIELGSGTVSHPLLGDEVRRRVESLQRVLAKCPRSITQPSPLFPANQALPSNVVFFFGFFCLFFLALGRKEKAKTKQKQRQRKDDKDGKAWCQNKTDKKKKTKKNKNKNDDGRQGLVLVHLCLFLINQALPSNVVFCFVFVLLVFDRKEVQGIEYKCFRKHMFGIWRSWPVPPSFW